MASLRSGAGDRACASVCSRAIVHPADDLAGALVDLASDALVHVEQLALPVERRLSRRLMQPRGVACDRREGSWLSSCASVDAIAMRDRSGARLCCRRSFC